MHAFRTDMRETHAKRVHFSHVRVFFDSRNVQKRVTKSDTSGYCLLLALHFGPRALDAGLRELCCDAFSADNSAAATDTLHWLPARWVTGSHRREMRVVKMRCAAPRGGAAGGRSSRACKGGWNPASRQSAGDCLSCACRAAPRCATDHAPLLATHVSPSSINIMLLALEENAASFAFLSFSKSIAHSCLRTS